MVTIEERPALRTGRLLTCMALSLVVHLLGVMALAVLAWKPWIPKIEVTWLDLDNTLGAPSPVPRPQKKRPPEPKKPPPKKRRVRPKPERESTVAVATAPRRPDAGVAPRPDRGPPSAPPTTEKAISNLAPGDAALMLLMRNDRILGSPYENEVRRLLHVFYDHKTLMWTSDLDPMKDFDALLIATPNPYRVTQTFLAARYKITRAKLKRALERSARFKNKRLRWIRLRGGGTTLRGEIPSPPKLPHDRRVVLLRDKLVMLTDPKHSQQLSAAMTPPSSRSDAGPPVQSWLDHLGQMGEVGGAAGTGGPGMILVAVNLPRLVRLPRDMPTPLSLSVTVPATDPTEVKGVMLFSDDKQARRFLAAVPARIRRAKRSLLLRFLGVTDLLEGIRLKREKERVLASTSLDRNQVCSLLELFRGMIPQVRVPGMPPRLPPDAGVPKPDAGPPGSGGTRAGKAAKAKRPDAGTDARGVRMME
jgi:hypothetical protein